MIVAMRAGVSFEAVRRRGAYSWLVTWRIANGADAAMTVLQAWHPHGRFHSSRLRRSLRVAPGRSGILELPARIAARSGDVVENCFLILVIAVRRERWRVLARFTLRLGADGTPRPTVEAVDAYPADR